MIYLKLLCTFFKIGLFSFGGGYAVLPMIQQEIVESNYWITSTQYIDLVGLSQMTPGPIAINAATFVGMKVGGVFGAIVATLGCILPSCIIMSVLAWYFFKKRELRFMQGILTGVRPVVIAMIAIACFDMAIKSLFSVGNIAISNIDWRAIIIFLFALIASFIKKINPIIIMIGSGILGILFYYVL